MCVYLYDLWKDFKSLALQITMCLVLWLAFYEVLSSKLELLRPQFFIYLFFLCIVVVIHFWYSKYSRTKNHNGLWEWPRHALKGPNFLLLFFFGKKYFWTSKPTLKSRVLKGIWWENNTFSHILFYRQKWL